MTMTETPAAPAPKKTRRKRAKRKAAAKPKVPSAFAGLTPTDCCSACNATACVISGRAYCAHPYKGGLRGADMAKEPAIARQEAAKKALGKAKVKVDAAI